MKKLLFLLLASFLVLAACGNEEEKSEDKKETKASDKEIKKDNNKKDDDKESDKEKYKPDSKEENSNEEVVTQDETTEQLQEQVNVQEQQATQQPVQSQEQTVTQNQQSLSDSKIQNRINEKSNSEDTAEVIRKAGEQSIEVENPSKTVEAKNQTGEPNQGQSNNDTGRIPYDKDHPTLHDESQMEVAYPDITNYADGKKHPAPTEYVGPNEHH